MFSLFFFRVKKNWVDVVTVPLLMAYTTRYFGSTGAIFVAKLVL